MYKIIVNSDVAKIILDYSEGYIDTPMGDTWGYDENITFAYIIDENRFILWDYRESKVRGIIIPDMTCSTEEEMFQISTVVDTLHYDLEFLKECQKVLLESKGQKIDGYIELLVYQIIMISLIKLQILF